MNAFTEMKKHPAWDELLREAGCKVTLGRIALLDALAEEAKPVTVSQLQAKLGPVLHGVTLYRALEAFVQAGLVRSIDFNHGHAHFELIVGKPHHHHLICTECEWVEDVATCPVPVRSSAAPTSSRFSSVRSHALEFFSICNRCTSMAG